MYDTIKKHEREAAILKAEEAKRRLEEADERYRAKVREREMMQGTTTAEEAVDAKIDKGERRTERDPNHQEHEDNSDTDDREADEDNERKRKRESEISQLRQDISAAKQAQRKKAEEKLQAKKKAEDMRRELLGESNSARVTITAAANNDEEDDDDDDIDDFDSFDDIQRKLQATSTGPSIKKKQRISSELEKSGTHQPKQQPSLIANILNAEGSTPIHDFSKQLSMSNDKLTSGGSIIFPIPGDDMYRAPWTPPDAPMDFIDGCLELMLPDLDVSSSSSASVGNNTLAIKFQAPAESERFSINIATSDRENERYDDILFHFNPRQFQKGGQLVINDRQETRWGNDISIPLSTIPLIFGAKSGSTLIVQINTEGFDVYVDGVHCARLEHRVKLPDSVGVGGQRHLPSLRLQFPSSNDYGDPENWLVHRVWWGYKPAMFDESTLDRIPGVNIVSAVHPRKLFISGLSRLFTDPEIDLRRAELERAFRKYGGPTGAVAVSIQKNSGFAFVDVATEELADLAVTEMANNCQYRVNKARRTRHEALLEERAAREKKEAEEGRGTAGSKETADWDRY